MLIIKLMLLPLSFLLAGNDPLIEQAKSDFSRANQSFMLPSFSVHMTYSYFKQPSDVKAYEVKTGVFYKAGDNSYSNISGIESLRTKNLSIAVQNEDKIMVVGNAIKSNPTVSMSPDSLLRFCSTINRSESPAGIVKYELVFDKRIYFEFERMEVYIDKKNSLLTKLVMIYSEQDVPSEDRPDETESMKPRIEVAYKNYSTAPLQKNVFTESTYVTKTAPNKYSAAGKYAGYAVYNQKFK